MKIKFIKIAYVFLMVVLLTVPTLLYSVPISAVTTPTIQDSLTTASTGGDSASIYGNNYGAMQFTASSTYSVNYIDVMLKKSGDPGDIEASIVTATAGVPTGTTDSITFDSIDGGTISDGYSWCRFTPSSTSETAVVSGTQYAIIIKAKGGDATHYIAWQVDTDGGVGTINYSHSADGGETWTTDSPKDGLFKVYGTDVLSIVSAKEFDDYITTDDMIFTIEYINTYPPYFTNNSDASATFYLQLRTSDNTVIIAQTPMKAWGDRPGSIYIGTSVAAGITAGSQLYIRMVLASNAAVYEEYQLASSDWLGKASPLSAHTSNFLLNVYDKITGQSEHSTLDQWVRSTADNIDDYNYVNYGTTTSLTTYLQNKGQVLAQATEGDSIFLNGIPSLNYVRPNLFEVVTAEASIETTDWDNTYVTDSDTVFANNVGTTVSGDMAALGNLFGITATAEDADNNEPSISVARKTMGTVIMLVAVAMAFFGLFAVGVGFAPVSLFLSMPLLFWGAQIRAIDIRLIGLVIFILFFICIRKYIWVEG
jgi:hypothetical protein